MSKEIFVKNKHLVKVLGWLETLSLPLRALVVTLTLIACVVLYITLLYGAYLVFGENGIAGVLLFTVLYIVVFSSLA